MRSNAPVALAFGLLRSACGVNAGGEGTDDAGSIADGGRSAAEDSGGEPPTDAGAVEDTGAGPTRDTGVPPAPRADASADSAPPPCAAAIDCEGVCGGPGVRVGGVCCADGKVDCNGICDGPGTSGGDASCCASGSVDCNGLCNGPGVVAHGACCADGVVDCSGACDGPGVVTNGGCCASGKIDCDGVCDGAGVLANGTCCASGWVDCNGVCNGPGVATGAACCASGLFDCNHVCNGPAVMNGNACCNSGKVDCAGVCDGPGIVAGARCCSTGTCPPPSCSDGYVDGTETGVDCGGDCINGCSGYGCKTSADCAGISSCSFGYCQPPPSPVAFALTFAGGVASLARNPIDGTVYAAIMAGDPTYGDAVIAFAPNQPTVQWSIPIGDSPGPIGVSDDGTTLYVATSLGVAQIDLASRTITRTFTLGSYPNSGSWYALEIHVLPGDASTIAVTGGFVDVTGTVGVHLFRNGVDVFPSPTEEGWQTNSQYNLSEVTSIAFQNAQTFFTYNGFTTKYDLGVVQIQPGGLYMTQDSPAVFTGFNDTIDFVGGKLFSSSGQVADGNGKIIGTFGQADTQIAMAVSTNASRVYFYRLDLDSSVREYFVDCDDPRSFTRSGGFVVDPALADPTNLGNAMGIVQWGTAGLALFTQTLGPGASEIILYPDILTRVHGCAPTATPPMQYGTIVAPDATSPDGSMHAYALATANLVSNPVTGDLYASVDGSDLRYPNQVVAFTTATTGVAWSVYAGSDPGPIDVSDSGHVAWVGLEGAPQVTSIDLTSKTAGTPFSMPQSTDDGDDYPQEVHAVPGTDTSVAAAGEYSGSTFESGLFLFDQGVSRYPFSQLSRNPSAGLQGFAFDGAATIYGNGNAGSLDTFSATVATFTLTSSSAFSLIPGGGNQPMVLAGGKLFAAFGTVLDPTTKAVLGTFSGNTGGPFALSPSGARYYSAGFGTSSTTTTISYAIACYAATTYAQTGSVAFTLPSGSDASAIALYGNAGREDEGSR